MVGVIMRSDNRNLDTVIAQVVHQHQSCPTHSIDRAKGFGAQQNALSFK